MLSLHVFFLKVLYMYPACYFSRNVPKFFMFQQILLHKNNTINQYFRNITVSNPKTLSTCLTYIGFNMVYAILQLYEMSINIIAMKCQQKKNTLQIWHCSTVINKLATLHKVLTRYIPHILHVFAYIFMEYT